MEQWDVYDINRNKTGKIAIRGNTLEKGDYHLVVFVIIQNSKDQFIISKRAPEKTAPNTWEVTGGSAIKGDSSYSAALREVDEELGIKLSSEGRLIKTIRSDSDCSHFSDVWYFREEFDIEKVICQPGEVSEARLATIDEILDLHDKGSFMPGKPGIVSCFKTYKDYNTF